jgi:hypothetical protein
LENLRLTGLYYHEGDSAAYDYWCRWNFILSNGQESAIKNDKVMTPHSLPEKLIRKVQMALNNSNFCLQGLKFFDEKDNLIFEIGKQDERFLVKEVLLQENERIIGFESRKHSDDRAIHNDFQFMIATLN